MRQSVFLLVIFSSSCIRCIACLKTCPNEWIEYDDSCYAFSKAALSWPQAQAVCLSFGGHLAELETPSEIDTIKSMTKSQRDNKDRWIGATDMFSEGNFVWATSGQKILDTDWGDGQPNNRNGAEDCVCIVATDILQYDWGDEGCERKLHFICEARLTDQTDWQCCKQIN